MTPASLQIWILQALEAAGAVAAGVVRAERMSVPDEAHAWFAAGNAVGMSYIKEHLTLREDPENVMPGVRSILCAAFPYDVKSPPSPPPAIAGYAMGEDYHVRVRRVLETVAKQLNERIACRWRVCVDTAPLPERHLAVQAGLGFIGTNTCLIVPGVGPNVVLGELLVDLEITPTEPAPRSCARCNRCIRDCPGGALSKDGRLDARRCLSYWTTAAKEAPPPELRSLGGGRFFGCETCVAICPHVGPKYNCDFYEQTVAAVQIPAFWKQPPWRDAVFAAAPAWRLARNQAWALEHIPW
ncbi:DUF1730 domain-containing protein [Myxococcota bacterium]|nr:DUF1730 domain-containing protein [Myxococcota bacterium]